MTGEQVRCSLEDLMEVVVLCLEGQNRPMMSSEMTEFRVEMSIEK